MLDHLFGAIPLLALPLAGGGGELSDAVIRLLIQLSIIIAAAKVAGELAVRFLKLPSVLGELGIGVLIGPYALGALPIPGWGPIFPNLATEVNPIPVSVELWSLAQLGSIVLLFHIGLETNLRQFLRYVGPATAVAIGGVVLPFGLGAGATVMFGFADSFLSPEALFMGSILTATSVGITARVLTDLNRLDAPEGVTIIAAAVVDDVLGILILTVVVGISAAGGFSLASLGWISFKAIGFWLGLTGVGLLIAPYLEKVMDKFRTSGAITVIPLALGFLAAGLSEIFGLAFIIGAFSIGLALSTTRMGHLAEVSMIGVIDFLVPVFFVVMGMLVDVGSMQGAVVFGLVVSVLAIFSKVVGSGVPAFATRFNFRGSARVGIGMMPRGEVALIIAGIGLSQHIIGQDLFGVSIMMTVITTLIAPVILVQLFEKGGSGVRGELEEGTAAATAPATAEAAED